MSVDKRETCTTCGNRYTIERSDYSNKGCKHDYVEGFVCMAFEHEGVANWMVGLDPDEAHCECWTGRRDDERRKI